MELVMREIVSYDLYNEIGENVYCIRHDVLFGEKQFGIYGIIKEKSFNDQIDSLRQTDMMALLSMILDNANKQTNTLNLKNIALSESKLISVKIMEDK